MSNNYGPRIVTDGLVLCLDAADRNSYAGSGNSCYDISGNGHVGTLTNGPTYSTTNNGIFTFDGTNDYIVVPGGGSLEISDTLTAMVWVYYISGNGRIFQKDGNGYTRCWEIGGYGGVFRIEMWHSNGTGTLGYGGSLAVNAWTHLAMTFNGSQILLYKNTNLVTTMNFVGDIRTSSSTPLFLGGLWHTGEYLNGKISHAQLYNTPLSQEQIQQNYDATKGRFGL